MQTMSRADMAKIAAIVAVIVLSLVAIFWVYSTSQPHVVHQINLPVGSSEKMQEMKNGGGESPSDNIDPSKYKH